MKKKGFLIAAIVCVCVALLAGTGVGGALLWRAMGIARYSRALEANWNVELPRAALLREEYAADTGASFHGDGTRYNVFSYRYEDSIDLMFAWGSGGHETLYHDSLADAADEWLDALGVPAAHRPDAQNCSHWYKTKRDNSELLFFWDAERDLLYVLQHLL